MQQTRTSLSFSAACTRRSSIQDRDLRQVARFAVCPIGGLLERSPLDRSGRLLHGQARRSRPHPFSSPSTFKYVEIH